MADRPEAHPDYRGRRRDGYDRKWQKLRAAHLAAEPLCRYCRELGYTTEAEVVDHIEPIRVNPSRRLDPTNLQSLCKACHDTVAQSRDVNGYLPGAKADGTPVDPNHPWNKT